ncbi:hypothetical protein UY3_13089 [Chelonia mydas]|uniref:Uncharacterized protein n=1 Tax=Chelonia mydas TaxID=8469 RepID=M7AWD8_CHEMY|nr:hypothetical protein UY3_13089 [Chelonia mydas]
MPRVGPAQGTGVMPGLRAASGLRTAQRFWLGGRQAEHGQFAPDSAVLRGSGVLVVGDLGTAISMSPLAALKVSGVEGIMTSPTCSHGIDRSPAITVEPQRYKYPMNNSEQNVMAVLSTEHRLNTALKLYYAEEKCCF